MHPALRWGLLIGLVNLVWLYASFYMGMHTRGLAALQMVVVVSAILNVMGYVFALGMETKRVGPMPYWKGVRLGAGISVVCALVAAAAQVGYFTVINPGWTEFMVSETRKHFEKQDLKPAVVEALAEKAGESFSLQTYLIQSVASALIIWIVLSLIIMLILRVKKAKPSRV